VTKEYERLTNLLSLSTCSVMQSGDVYPCYDTMLESVTRNKILRMPQYESFLGIAPCDYSLFRTIHDLHHILLNVDFSYEGEYLACNMLINALSKQGASPLVRWFTRSAIIYNVALVNAGVKSDDNKVVLNNLFY
jgi:hypothetical protein